MAKKVWTPEERKAFGETPFRKTSAYRSLHLWVEVRLGKPHYCSDCGDTELKHRQYHWANVSGEYKRELSDWKRLCVQCHKKFDGYGLNTGYCKNGHEIDESKAYFRSDGYVECLVCKKERSAAWYQENRTRILSKLRKANA